ncbi:MAG: hypothetical protein CVV44_14445 [Spirochaetae bacterium HGW-Spirochaetae-1]|jgi:hypothetical protein|nr:MAG: hypothetical protein CVV44_14445 [Spirochaetae bacterium HGW-Spirochaetae-1]
MESLKECCFKIRDYFSGAATDTAWQPDERFHACLLTFDGTKGETVKKALMDMYNNCYDSSTVKKASKQEIKLVKSFAGLEKGQLLFTAGEGEVTLFGAWWPWRDNSKISLRVGFFSIEKNASDEDALFNIIREIFMKDR